MDYYIYKNDQNIGPLPESEVISGLKTGRYLANDVGCRVGDTDWKDLSILFPLETAAPLAPMRQPIYQEPPQKIIRQPHQIVHQPQVVYQPPINTSGSSDMTRLMYFEANKKSAGTAYLLLIFLGGFSAHRFYLGRPGSAIAQLLIWWISLVLIIVGIGLITMWITPIWLLVDLFLIPQMVRDHNNMLLVQANSFR